MGGWGGERVVGKTQRSASPGSLRGETCLHPRPARLPRSRPAGSPSPGCSAAGSLPAPGAPRPALTAEPGAPSHPAGGAGGGKSLEPGAGVEGPGAAGAGAGGESGVAAQPGDGISPLPAAAAAVIFQAHRGSPLRAPLPSALPPRPGSSRRRLPSARPRRGWPGAGAAPGAARGAPAGPGGAAPAPRPLPAAGSGARPKGRRGISRHPRVLEEPHPTLQLGFGLLFAFWFFFLPPERCEDLSCDRRELSGVCVPSPVSGGCEKKDASWYSCFYVITKHVEIFSSACEEVDKESPNIKAPRPSLPAKRKREKIKDEEEKIRDEDGFISSEAVSEQNSCSVNGGRCSKLGSVCTGMPTSVCWVNGTGVLFFSALDEGSKWV